MNHLQKNLLVIKAAKEGDVSALQEYLTQNPENVNIWDQNGYAPLHHVMRHKEKAQELINLLLDFGANIDITDHKGRTSIVHALLYDNPLALKTLITKGADIFIPDHLKTTPIFYATINHTNPQLLKILLQTGALDLEKDPTCKTLLHTIAIESSKYIKDMLRNASECNFPNNKKLFSLGQIANYLIAYGQPIDMEDISLIGYLANYFSSLASYFATEEPIITTSTLSKLSLAFVQYVQNTEELTKNKVDIVLALDRLFEFLPPNHLSPLIVKAKNDVLQEAAKKDCITQILVMTKQIKVHFFLDAKEEIGLSPKLPASPLKSLLSFIQHKLDLNEDLSALFDEMKHLYDDLFNLDHLDMYQHNFANILEEIKQATKQLEIKLEIDLITQFHDDSFEGKCSDMQISGGISDEYHPA